MLRVCRWKPEADTEARSCLVTYEKILEAVAKPAREKATIRLETKVVKVVADEGRSKPELEIADGTRLAFDEVVCTMPLGM